MRGSNMSLGAQSHATEQKLVTEAKRLNGIVERLGGEAAESRSTMLSRIEDMTRERERIVGELSMKLQATEAERDTTASKLRETVDKLRWVQKKALEDGSVRPGRYRAYMYYETLKNAQAEEQATSWRTDGDTSALSAQIAVEHQTDAIKRGMQRGAPDQPAGLAW